MKPKQFLKYLQNQGVEIQQGTKHYRLYRNGKNTQFTRSSKDIAEATISKIKKQLDIQ
ncbi:TPA: mRNA interferase [Haemophilus influenzae]|uniref:mRNA interferase n=1 Tax=Haemophilus influenzae TaxID=727 RepID=UPI000CFFEEB3|nr:mRNA interferase [Haemophilus influenzae]